MDSEPIQTSLPDIILRPLATERDVDLAKELFMEYAQSLGVMPDLPEFENELALLPGDYVAPDGMVLLAFVDEHPVGCGAFRPLRDSDYANACEMRHLYVRPSFRGFGLGRQLAETLLECARNTGYSTVLLDTLNEMQTARELYQSLGFEEIPPYYYSPLPGAHYLKVELE